MNRAVRGISLLLSVALIVLCAQPRPVAAAELPAVPKTFLVLDVSGSTEKAREPLKSLYRYLFALFAECPYEMDLTTCFFDEGLYTDDQYIIRTRVGGEGGEPNAQAELAANKLQEDLDDRAFFTKDTAVYDSLKEFENAFIRTLKEDEKEDINIIVFTDMHSTKNALTNTPEAVSRLFSSWKEEGFSVKGLIWQDVGTKSIHFESDGVRNKIYEVELANMMGAYECLFHIYFDLITGGYPDGYDFNYAQIPDVPVVIYPNAYELYIITRDSDATLRYVDDGSMRDISADELFPVDDYTDDPPRILRIGKSRLDEIGSAFLALNVSEFQVYTIFSPEITNFEIRQNKQSDLIRAGGETTEFTITFAPKIKLWEQSALKLTAEVVITKDGENDVKHIPIEGPPEGNRFSTKKEDVFAEAGEHDITVQIMDKDGNVIAERKTGQYVVNSRPDNTGGEEDGIGEKEFKNPTAIIIGVFVLLLAVVALAVAGNRYRRNKRRERPWNL